MMWYFFVLTAVTGAALTAGFCMGRISNGNRDWEDTGEDVPEDGVREEGRKAGSASRRHEAEKERGIRPMDGREEGCGFGFVGSPVSGEILDRREGERPAIAIYPDEDRLYAPANGKVIKIFPLGNQFLLSAESGQEFLIRAGDSQDELMGKYFRPRILQNEIVGKGKLLLEFDRRGLEAEGVSAKVQISVETGSCDSSVLPEAGERIRTGEEIFRVRESV